MSARHHVRRKRRQKKMRLGSGGKFRIRHRRVAGRTGSSRPSGSRRYRSWRPNPPFPAQEPRP